MHIFFSQDSPVSRTKFYLPEGIWPAIEGRAGLPPYKLDWLCEKQRIGDLPLKVSPRDFGRSLSGRAFFIWYTNTFVLKRTPLFISLS